MNVKKQLAYICLFVCLSCNRSEVIELPADPQIPVRFQLCLHKEVLPFSGMRSIPLFTITEPTSKSDNDNYEDNEESEIQDLCSYIEYIVYTADTEAPFKVKSFTWEEDDFGIIYDSLPAGNYTIAILAHSSPTTTLSEKVIKFDNISDTFHAQKELKIESQTSINDDFTLTRIVSKIEFMAKEPVTEELKSFNMKVDQWYSAIHVITGKGEPETEEKSFVHEFTPEEIGKSNLTFGFLSFIPPTESTTLTVDLFSTNTANEITKEYKVPAITPIANRTIRYSGLLYSHPDSESTLTLSVLNGGEWEGIDENELTD